MYLVDANVASEARRGTAEAVAWLRSVNPLSMRLSVITLREMMRGVALKQASDPAAALHLTNWMQTLRRDHRERILPITSEIAIEWSRLAALRSRGDADGLIAATAIVHDLAIVTRNVGDFSDTSAALLNPWDVAAWVTPHRYCARSPKREFICPRTSPSSSSARRARRWAPFSAI